MTSVLHLTTTDESLELLLGPQLRSFAAAGYDVHTASAPGPFVERLVADGIQHHPLVRSTRSMDLRGDLAAARELGSLIRRLRPDILHTHNPKPGVYGRILGRMLRVPVVINTVHGFYATATDRPAKRRVVYSLERLAAAFSHLELIQSREDLALLARWRVPADRLQHLGNGIDLDRFHPDPDDRREVRAELGIADDEIAVLSVGRMVREKGFPELIEAARLLQVSHPHVRLLFVGGLDDQKHDHIARDEIAKAMDGTNCQWLGRRSDVERLYRAADIFVLASHREGFPRAAMEAAASGLPVIATDIRGCREVVDHQQNGLLVEVRQPTALAEAIGQLVDSAGTRAAFGRASSSKATSTFDDQLIIDRTLAAYRRLAPLPN